MQAKLILKQIGFSKIASNFSGAFLWMNSCRVINELHISTLQSNQFAHEHEMKQLKNSTCI